jgi:C4-dicarboxylate-specific signal transduction histidine kinase
MEERAELDKLSREQLLERVKVLEGRAKKLQDLVEIISRGKYMWESTFDAITAPVQIVSENYEIVRANLTLAAVGGKDITSIIGKKCYEAYAGRDAPCEDCPLKAALERDDRVQSTLGNKIEKREFEVYAYPLGAGGSPGTAVLYYRDVSEERRLQREVIQQEKMAAIGLLAGGVAHEINNPIGGILAFTQLMKRDATDNKAVMDDLEEIEKAAIRCKKIVSDLLDFSRVTREGDRAGVDINILLEKIFPFLQREMRSFNVELEFRGDPNLPQVVGHADRLQQVFINLMTNACHAMPKGGVLTVETSRDDDGTVLVKVRDTGEGIPKDLCERIFDPFFTTKEPGKGTGLGLSISYRIVREHGGEITRQLVPRGNNQHGGQDGENPYRG